MGWFDALFPSMGEDAENRWNRSEKNLFPKPVPSKYRVGADKNRGTGGTGEKQQKRKKACVETDRQECLSEWLKTLKPVPKHICRKLVPEEEKHLQNFIKLLVASRAGDTMYRISGSDLWRLQGEYEKATVFKFSMRIDYFDHYVAQATGAQVMQAPDGQVWLIGIAERC